MFVVQYPDPAAAHVFVWAANSGEQLECVVSEFLLQNVKYDATAAIEQRWREVARIMEGWHPWLVLQVLG